MYHSDNHSFRKKLNWLAISIGVLFFYFGVLKFFPNQSPAEQIGVNTLCKLCFGLLPPKLCLLSLAFLEVAIGLCLMTRSFFKIAVAVAIAHLVMTFSPLLFFPELIFQETLISPTLLGQYIYKNIVLIFALLVIYPSHQELVRVKAS